MSDARMIIAHLLASPFYGGPERQMLGLARHLPATTQSIFLSFAENGKSAPFLGEVRRHGFMGLALTQNTPRIRAAAREVAEHLQEIRADLLTTSGYKPDIVGWLAARRAGIPVVAVAHGWTAATLKVRFYEMLDRFAMRRMDAVVCVSEAQASRVRRARVAEHKIKTIRNAVSDEAFDAPEPAYAERLRGYFAKPPKYVVGAAGRLSPEKGFDQLVYAAEILLRQGQDVGFVHFGDGPLRDHLARRIKAKGLADRFIFAGFRSDVCRFLPHLDLVVLPSYTEGLPVVLLEALAAGVPVVATAVGGTPEVVEDGKCGYLVPPGDPVALARRVLQLLIDEPRRREMGRQGRARVRNHFTFEAQAKAYQDLFDELLVKPTKSHALASVEA